MAGFKQGVVSVGTTATRICTIGAAPDADRVIVQNNGTTAVFLGGSDVTTSGATAGVQVAANGTLTVPTTGAEPLTLFGICASGTNNASYLFPG